MDTSAKTYASEAYSASQMVSLRLTSLTELDNGWDACCAPSGDE